MVPRPTENNFNVVNNAISDGSDIQTEEERLYCGKWCGDYAQVPLRGMNRKPVCYTVAFAAQSMIL